MVLGIMLYFIILAVMVSTIVFIIVKAVRKNFHDKNVSEISNKIKSMLNNDVEKQKVETSKLKRCSYCGGSFEGTKCPHCGAVEIKK